jgi:riboflavin biosynthesis pyrimidine reductase
LKGAGVASVLCEGGPTFAALLLAGGFVDRLVWLVAPVFLRGPLAVPALAGAVGGKLDEWRFERIERCGDDLLLTAKLRPNV